MIKIWGYSETTNQYGGSGHVRYVGKCHRNEFIDSILGGLTRGRSWIAARACITGNADDIKEALAHRDQIVIIDDPVLGPRGQILKTIPIFHGVRGRR